MKSRRDRILALHAEGVAPVEIARIVGVTPGRVRQVIPRYTTEELEALRERVRVRAGELRDAGAWPWADTAGASPEVP